MGARLGVPRQSVRRYRTGTYTGAAQIVSNAQLDRSMQPVAPPGFHLVKHDENGLLLHWSDWQIEKDTA